MDAYKCDYNSYRKRVDKRMFGKYSWDDFQTCRKP